MPAKARRKSPAAKTAPRSSCSPPQMRHVPCAHRSPASYGFPRSPKGLLDWNWARERLTNSHNYVIVAVRPDERLHAQGYAWSMA